MRINLKTTDAIFPMPVLLISTFNDDNTVNVMNAAWAMMQEKDYIVLNLTESHKTVKNIKKRKAFCVSIANSKYVGEADYFGIESGNKVNNKLGKTNLTYEKSNNIDAPIINEFPICIECEFIEFQTNKYGCGVIGKIVNVSADKKVMKDNNVDVDLLDAIAFDPFTNGYYKVNTRVANAFESGMKYKK